MSLTDNPQLRPVDGITKNEYQRITDFLQGAVYCWCKNQKDEWFSLKDLMGGDNYFWQNTPLLPLFIKHEGVEDDPVLEAGKDAGWILKSVVFEDKRRFETKREALIRVYRWIGEEEYT